MRLRRWVQSIFFIVHIKKTQKGKDQVKPFLLGWRDAWTYEKRAQSPRRAPQRGALPSDHRRVPGSLRRLVLSVGAVSRFRDEPRPRFCRRSTVARRGVGAVVDRDELLPAGNGVDLGRVLGEVDRLGGAADRVRLPQGLVGPRAAGG